MEHKKLSEGDNVAGLAEQMRFSPRKTNSFQSSGVSGCVFVLQVHSLLGLVPAKQQPLRVFQRGADAQLESTRRRRCGLIECFYIHAWCLANRAHVPFKVLISLSCLCASLCPTHKSVGLDIQKSPDVPCDLMRRLTTNTSMGDVNTWYLCFHCIKIRTDCIQELQTLNAPFSAATSNFPELTCSKMGILVVEYVVVSSLESS